MKKKMKKNPKEPNAPVPREGDNYIIDVETLRQMFCSLTQMFYSLNYVFHLLLSGMAYLKVRAWKCVIKTQLDI